jgi:predicted SnoaL-like aldol condensation-catalyzing enzyme
MNYKQKARAYHQAVSAYDTATVTSMVHENYIQHNPKVPTGREAFVDLLPKLKEFGSKIENIRMLEHDPYIIMHHRWQNAEPFGAKETAAFHVIRFDDDGLIAEHWNVMTPLLPPNPSGRSLLDGERQITDLDQTNENIRITREMFQKWVLYSQEKYQDLLVEFFYSDFHQHHPLIADGIDGFMQAFRDQKIDFRYKKNHAVFGEGNFTLSVSEGESNGSLSAFYDLYRWNRGKVAEHWSVIQQIPTEGLANNNTMFNFR